MSLFSPFRSSSRANSLSRSLPSRGSSLNYLSLLHALENGWEILESHVISGHGSNGHGEHFSLKLHHPGRRQSSGMTVEKSAAIEALLHRRGKR
jgi:hypothetical protein